MRLEIATSLANLGVWEYHPINKKLHWDATAGRLLGYENPENDSANCRSQGLSIENMLPVWTECVVDRIDPCSLLFQVDDPDSDKSSSAPDRMPTRVATRDGEIRYLRIASKRIQREDGETVFVGTFQDMTKRWLNDAQIQSTLRTAGIEVWDYDVSADTRNSLRNPRPEPSRDHQSIVATTAEDLKEWMTTVHEDDWENFQDQLEQYREGNPPLFECKYRIKDQDGSWRWVQDVGEVIQRDQNGAPIRMMGVRIDHQNARIMADCLDLAISAADAGVWDWHIPTGRVVTNHRYHTMLGEDERDTPFQVEEFQRRVHPDDYERVLEKVAHAHANGDASYIVEFRFQCADGSYKWIHSSGRVVERNEAGAPVRMIGQHVDIDLQRRTLESIERLNEQLEQQIAVANRMARRAEAASRFKSQFLANMSHEIRTPLTAILGYSEALSETLSGFPESDESLRSVETIHRNGEHLLSLINDILDLSKIEEGRLNLEIISFSPREVLHEVDALMRVRAEQKSIQWDVEIDGEMPCRVHSDPTRLRQILLNLVGNAMKFTEFGSVHLVARAKAVSEGMRLEFAVSDTGVGMTQQSMDHLFQPFVQADNSMSRRFGGTGLGLTISRQLARMLGGDIQVESELGKGSVFRVNILVRQNDPANVCLCSAVSDCQFNPTKQKVAGGQPLSAGTGLEDVHCLLVEDGLDNQRLIKMFLNKAGAKVHVCENGQKGVEEYFKANEANHPYDMILMDMQMPIMDGYTATRLLRERGAEVPVIALTAHAMSDSRKACMDAGCDDFATKPIHRAKLIELVRRYRLASRDRGSASQPIAAGSVSCE